MRIKAVHIKNFRCLRDVSVDFDAVTTLIGPNGSGKSTILRALDWFFNGSQESLSEKDRYSGAMEDAATSVDVVFDDIKAEDRVALGKYAPEGSATVEIRRSWDGQRDKMSGKARSFPAFDRVREQGSASDKKTAYEEVRADIDIPKWTKAADAEAAMTAWESQNRELLEETELDTPHLFGFNGQNKLSGLFDYVLVSADLRASEETAEGRRTIIGRILERAVDRAGADEALAELSVAVSEQQKLVQEEHLGHQLESLAKELSDEVASFSTGRQVLLNAEPPVVRPSAVTIRLAIKDAEVETSVDRQGHGFQRTILISCLRVLAKRGSQEAGSTIMLAIEEPELFQHPSQAKAFARVLQSLAADDNGLQIAYATHSPYFVDPTFFDQIRRVGRTDSADGHPDVTIRHATSEAVAARIDGFATREALLGRWDQVCTRNLSEALFANAVILTEGATDVGILEGIVSRADHRHFDVDGICVAEAGGKSLVFIPHAILAELGIPTLVVFDSDRGQSARMLVADPAKTAEAAAIDAISRTTNRNILRYFGLPEEDYPASLLSSGLFAWDDDLERVLEVEWPAWEVARKVIVKQGRGVDKKNPATYRLAAKEALDAPTGALLDVVNAARALV